MNGYTPWWKMKVKRKWIRDEINRKNGDGNRGKKWESDREKNLQRRRELHWKEKERKSLLGLSKYNLWVYVCVWMWVCVCPRGLVLPSVHQRVALFYMTGKKNNNNNNSKALRSYPISTTTHTSGKKKITVIHLSVYYATFGTNGLQKNISGQKKYL